MESNRLAERLPWRPGAYVEPSDEGATEITVVTDKNDLLENELIGMVGATAVIADMVICGSSLWRVYKQEQAHLHLAPQLMIERLKLVYHLKGRELFRVLNRG